MPRSPFAIRDFRLFWISRLAATLAQIAIVVVIGWQVYDIARTEGLSEKAAALQLGFVGLALGSKELDLRIQALVAHSVNCQFSTSGCFKSRSSHFFDCRGLFHKLREQGDLIGRLFAQFQSRLQQPLSGFGNRVIRGPRRLVHS